MIGDDFVDVLYADFFAVRLLEGTVGKLSIVCWFTLGEIVSDCWSVKLAVSVNKRYGVCIGHLSS